MSNAPAPQATSIDPKVSIVRLHGEACFYCGAVTATLHAAGSVTLPGTDRVWPIVTCGCRSAVTA